MANEQSLNGNTSTVLGTSQNCTGKKTPLDEGSLCSQPSLGLSRSQKRRKRKKEIRRAKAKAKIVLDIHPPEVTSLENHPSAKDSESSPPEIDGSKPTEGGVSLEICPPPQKKGRKNDDIDGRCAKDSSLDIVSVKLDSDLHHMKTTCLTHISEMTVMGSGNQQASQEGSFADHCVTNVGVLEKSDEHSGQEFLEELDNSEKYLDASSVGKHQGASGSNVSSSNLSDTKTNQRGRSSDSTLIVTTSVKEDTMSSIPVQQDSPMGDTSVSDCKNQVTYYRKRKNESSGSQLSNLESLKEDTSPVEMFMQNSSAGDTPMDHLDTAVISAPPKKITEEVVETHNISLLVAGDIVMGKPFGECPDDYPVSKEEEKIPSSLGTEVASSSQLGTSEDNSSLGVSTMGNPQQALDSSAHLRNSRKKLLVLDVNGILADIVVCGTERVKPDIIVSGKAVFKRPFCDDFLQFCFERFHVGVWSSRTKRNVEAVVNFLMPNSKHNLLFCWDQSHCTETGFNTVENREKPLVLKELKNLWEKNRRGLPWKRGEYNETNTLLLDDSPYKALRNPPYTAIFPHPYKYWDAKDNCLGPGGDLRVYLEGLAEADDIQSYVKLNPFGQRPITERNASWRFYLKVIGTNTLKDEEEDTSNGSACVSKESATETLLMTNSAPAANA